MKATHKGTCQVCGSVQKLPNGELAKHGYTVEWGFFSGVCKGSHNPPFEQSCGLIQASIESAERMLAETSHEVTELALSTSSTVWMQLYKKPTFRDKGGYYWKQVELTLHVNRSKEDGYEWTTFSYVDDEGKEHKVDAYDAAGHYAKTMIQAATYFNARYIKSVLSPRSVRLTQYITWQRERVATWKPAELKSL